LEVKNPMREQWELFAKQAKMSWSFGKPLSLAQTTFWVLCLFAASGLSVVAAPTQQEPSQSASAQQKRDFPEGPGRDTFLRLCSRCHSPANVIPNGQSREGWEDTITKMVALGASGTDEEFSDILDYLAKNFPADSHPKVNVNKATADQLRTGLGLSSKEAEGIVGYRQKNGDFKSLEELKKVPELDPAKLDAKKSLVIFQ
jgi:competence protein ComEA